MNTLDGKLPKIEILEISKDQIKFVLENTEVSIANTLRRIMLAEISGTNCLSSRSLSQFV